jgi:predicted nucleic acid-binding protein
VSYLIDANVISEICKGDRCHRQVASWHASIEDVEIYLSVLVLGEIRRGVDGQGRRSPHALALWTSGSLFCGTPLPIASSHRQ